MIVYSLDTEGHIKYINQRWCTYTGLSLEQSLGAFWSRGVHSEDMPRVTEAINNAARAEVDLEVECRLKRADGAYRWHLLRAEVKREKDIFSGWFGSFMDIDDRKKIEEINKADQAKSRFLASMSHGTPVF